jgi:predicted Rossmann fold nucleotide-binding protein DprA/Smf involved in DNA uptake
MQFYGMTGDLFMESDSANTEIRQLQLDFLQKQIYNLLQKGDMGSEEIAGSIECPQSEINAALTMMELFGIICRQPGAKYGLKN